MGNIKVKHDDEWKVVSSNTANGISANSPLIQKDENTSVEDVLVDHEGRVDKLEKNVAWLAKYGIGKGGSGGGGGSSDADATCEILVNGVSQAEVSSTPLGYNTSGLTVLLSNIKNGSRSNWSVTVTSGGNITIQSGTVSVSNPQLTISYSRLQNAYPNHNGTLVVTAYYFDSSTNVVGQATWRGTIYEAVIGLSAPNVSVDILNDVDSGGDIVGSKLINYSYTVGDVSSDYNLHVQAFKGGVEVGDTIDRLVSVQSTSGTLQVILKDIITDVEPGAYLVHGTLSSVNNPNISTTIITAVTCVSEEIAIISTELSESSLSPITASTSGVLAMNWAAFVSGYTVFSYYYIISYTRENGESATLSTDPKNGYFGQPISDALSALNKDWSYIDSELSVTIHVAASSSKYADKSYYFRMVKSEDNFLGLRAAIVNLQLCDFSARSTEENTDLTYDMVNAHFYNNGVYGSLESRLSLHNASALAGIRGGTGNTPYYLRLSNGAYGKLSLTGGDNVGNNPNFKTLVDNNGHNFTISICFKADYHPDDHRTVLLWGRSDNTTGNPVSGIEIGVHDIFVDGNSVVSLIDDTINMIDITCESITRQVGDGEAENLILKIYVNGVVSAATSITNPSTFYLSDDIFIGGKERMNNVLEEWCCDCNIYSIQVYDTVLNEFDIMLNNINSKIATTRRNNTWDFSVIDNELRKNLCYRNDDGSVSSAIYDVENGHFKNPDFLTYENNGWTISSDNIERAESIGLPIMLVDVSRNRNWTFDSFVSQQSRDNSLDPTEDNCKIYYWDPDGNNSSIVSFDNVIVGLQGTSTLSDAVKNIDITLSDDTVFIPKEDWLPEQTYTLKADVVDSSHSCNAAIGKFVNTKLKDWMPLPNEAKSNVASSSYVQNQQPTATLKHTVEGFPVFLFMSFHMDSDQGIETTPLGIYSFNLGRNAYRNLGFESISSIEFGSSPIVINSFPYAANNCQINVVQNSGQGCRWVEIKDSGSIDGLSTIIPGGDNNNEDLDTSRAEFWNNDLSLVNQRYEIRYPLSDSFSQNDDFVRLLNIIMGYPIEPTYKTVDPIGTLSKEDLSFKYPLYRYNNGYEKTGEYFSTSTNTNDLYQPNLDLGSAYTYFIVACAFGLVDNLGKNSTYRRWNSNGNYYLGLYDLDSSLGGSNQGNIDVKPNMWIKYLEKPEGTTINYASETWDKSMASYTDTLFTAYYSKLWLSIDTQAFRTKNDSGGNSQYASYWRSFRELTQSLANENNYTDFVDYFMDEYFLAQTEKCGSLIFNLDYRMKYFQQFNFTDSSKISGHLGKLHGRKEAYVRDWLKHRFLFLDSLFAWRDGGNSVYQFKNDYNSNLYGNVRRTPEKLPLRFNSDLIIKHNVGDGTNTYYYAPANTDVYVDMGNNTGDDPRVWGITNSPQLIQIGNEDFPWSSVGVARINHNPTTSDVTTAWSSPGLPCITALDIPGNKSFEGGLNILNSFTPREGISELRSIDLSNTGVYSGGSITLALETELIDGTKYTPFPKLRSIDISNSSAISNIALPSIPLKSDGLSLRGSAITQFSLIDQRFLESVDLTGCNSITNVTIRNCESYIRQELNGLSNLEQVTIDANNSIEEITISNCQHLTSVSISQNPELKTITITNCSTLITLNIVGSESLETLIISNNSSLQGIHLEDLGSGDDWSNVKTLELSGSPIKSIIGNNNLDTTVGNGNTDSLLDLHFFKGLESFDIHNNKEVQHIQFANEQNKAITVNSFSGCVQLKRVYGHVELYATNQSSSGDTGSPFYGCSKFTIHGDDGTGLGISTFKGKNVRENNNRVKTPWDLYDTEGHDTTWSDVFQENGRVTNFKIHSRCTLNYTFYKTSLTQFDVYYTCFAIAQAKISESFSINYTWFELARSTNQYSLFAWSPGVVENYPSRTMFKGWGRCTGFDRGFSSVGGKNANTIYLLSPTVESGVVTKDDGIFSPLVSITTTHYIFGSRSSSFSRYVWRRSNNNQYAVRTLGILPVSDVYSDDSWVINGDPEPAVSARGNLTDFFLNLGNLTTIYSTLNCRYIDFSTISIPSSVTYLYRAFIATQYGKGEVNFNDIFQEDNNVKTITGSFGITGSDISYLAEGEEQAFIQFNSATFSNLPNLVRFGYYPGTPIYGEIDSPSLRGLNKKLSQSFPYDLFASNPNLRVATNIFEDCDGSAINEVYFPHTLFSNTPNLTHIDAFFKNSIFNLHLTSEGFANCPNLTSVRQLFYEGKKGAGNTLRQCLISTSIPYKFLYHGEPSEPTTITYKGKNGDTEPVDTTGIQEESVSFSIPYNRISDMRQMFRGCYRLDCYKVSNSNDIIESNPDYKPFHWIYNEQTGTWTENLEDKEQQAYWGFDGDFNSDAYSNSFFTNNKLLEEKGVSFDVNLNYYSGSGDGKVGTANYMCPPDLLRYSTVSCDITGLFEYCGKDMSTHGDVENDNAGYGYGIKGRICPYLLKPVPGTSSLARMFKFCRMLSGYSDSTGVWLIPPSFFNYTPNIQTLTETFEGMLFPEGVNLNVFSSLKKPLDVRKIFAHSMYYGITTIDGIFTNNTISLISGAFSTNDVVITGSSPVVSFNRNWSLSLGSNDVQVSAANNFTLSKIPKSENIYYVYYGWGAKASDAAIPNSNDNY